MENLQQEPLQDPLDERKARILTWGIESSGKDIAPALQQLLLDTAYENILPVSC